MPPVIQIENVSKLYKLGFYGADTFRDEVLNFFARLRGKPPVNSVVGATNNLADKDSDSDLVWALKDINLTVNQGDIVGIIGKNGAGKSTLLKILSKITTPTTGSVKIRGRIASLLEVGTGMHEELTGRENIFLNGAILGMTKHEIRSKLDEIIDFAGIAKYIDTPIKRYSSGMRIRLGFAIAAHLEPEILIVDEVLAVGDAEFQKRAIGKMQDISKGEGRTVLFVSHNMGSVRALCKTGILLNQGQVEMIDDINTVVDKYTSINTSDIKKEIKINNSDHVAAVNKEFEYTNIKILNDVFNVSNEEPLEFEVSFKRNKTNIKRCQFGIIIKNEEEIFVGGLYSQEIDIPDNAVAMKAKIILYNHQLSKGKYSLNFNISEYSNTTIPKTYDLIPHAVSFEIKYQDKEHKRPIAFWPKIGNIAFNNTQIAIETIE